MVGVRAFSPQDHTVSAPRVRHDHGRGETAENMDPGLLLHLLGVCKNRFAVAFSGRALVRREKEQTCSLLRFPVAREDFV